MKSEVGSGYCEHCGKGACSWACLEQHESRCTYGNDADSARLAQHGNQTLSKCVNCGTPCKQNEGRCDVCIRPLCSHRCGQVHEPQCRQRATNDRATSSQPQCRTCGTLPRSSTRRSTSSTPRTSLADGDDGSSDSDELTFGLSFELLSGRDASNPESSVESMLGAVKRERIRRIPTGWGSMHARLGRDRWPRGTAG